MNKVAENLAFALGTEEQAQAGESRMPRHREADIRGKVVIITGASRGVGKQAAIDFARRGANVVLAARTVDPDPSVPGTIGETLKEIEDAGGQAIAIATDLALEADLKALVDAAVARFGGVDILVNNAAATQARSGASRSSR